MTVNRRSFLLGSSAAFAGLVLPRLARGQETGLSRVVVVSDGRAWSGPGWADADLDRGFVRQMVERAICDLTGQADALAAIGGLFPGGLNAESRICIKVNCVNSDLPSHPAVVVGLVDLLAQAGAAPGNIIVFDRMDSDLADCGFTPNRGAGLQVLGTDHSGVGYDERPVTFSDGVLRLSSILTEGCDHLINVPVLKNHEMAGVTLALKNHFGSIDRPMLLHGADRSCCPGIAELNARPEIDDKTRLVLVDALFATYKGGLGSLPDFAPMAVLAAQDPVAIDAVGQHLINVRRASEGLAPIDAQHIRQAAEHGLGLSDLERIERLDVALSPVTEKPKPWLEEPESEKPTSGCGAQGGFSSTGLAAGLGAVVGLAARHLKP
jgi:uncharacterized protein (DUF362 family)